MVKSNKVLDDDDDFNATNTFATIFDRRKHRNLNGTPNFFPSAVATYYSSIGVHFIEDKGTNYIYSLNEACFVSRGYTYCSSGRAFDFYSE